MPSISRSIATAKCEQYTVDVLAQTFGTCKCGHAKAEHTPAALAGRSSESTRVKGASSSGIPAEDDDKVDCPLYEVNTTADSFGQCKCGAPKAKHTEAALLKSGSNVNSNIRLSRQNQESNGKDEDDRGRDSEASKEVRRVSRRSRSPRLDAKLKTTSTAAYVDCGAYVVDVRAASFGACKCGHAKVDHSHAALSEGAAERMDAAMTDKWKGSGTVRPRLDSGLSHATDDSSAGNVRVSNSAPVSPTSASAFAENDKSAGENSALVEEEEEGRSARAEEDTSIALKEDGEEDGEALKSEGVAEAPTEEKVEIVEEPTEGRKEEEGPGKEEKEIEEQEEAPGSESDDDDDEGEEASFVSSPSMEATKVTSLDDDDATLTAAAATAAYNNINNAASPAKGEASNTDAPVGAADQHTFPNPLGNPAAHSGQPDSTREADKDSNTEADQSNDLPLDEAEPPALEATIVREKSGTVDLDVSQNGAMGHREPIVAVNHGGRGPPAPPTTPPPKTGVCSTCSLLWFTS